MPRPTILGRALRYLTDSYQYATAPYKASSRRGAGRGTGMVLRVLSPSARIREVDTSDDDYFLRLAVNNPEVWSAMTTIADRVADLDAFVVQEFVPDTAADSDAKGEWVDIENHPFIRLVRRPNSLIPGGLLLRDTVMWFVAMANAYWFLVTDTPGVGPIREIWPLPATKVKPVPENLRISLLTGGLTIDYEYTLSTPVLLPGENVIHFRGPNLFDYWEGMSNLTPLQESLESYRDQAHWLKSFFGKGNAVPTAVISLPPEITDDEFEAVKQDIMEQFGGQRRTAVTRAGDFDVKPIAHTIEEMQVLEGLTHHDNQARKVFKMPAGLTDASSGQARLAAETSLGRDVIQPLLNYLAEFMTLAAIPYYAEEGKELRVAARDIVPQDRSLEVTEYQVYGEDRTVNENRRKQKLDPLVLEGDLAPLQPLVDKIPKGLFPWLAPALAQMIGQQQGGQAAYDPMLAVVRELAGLDMIRQMAGRDPEFIVNLMTNGIAGQLFDRPVGAPVGLGAGGMAVGQMPPLPMGSGGELTEVGAYTGQLPTQDQLMAQLGIASRTLPLNDAEKEAAVWAALQAIKANGAGSAELRAALEAIQRRW